MHPRKFSAALRAKGQGIALDINRDFTTSQKLNAAMQPLFQSRQRGERRRLSD